MAISNNRGVEIPIEAKLQGFDKAFAQISTGASQAASKMNATFASLNAGRGAALGAAAALAATVAVFVKSTDEIAAYKGLSEQIGDTAQAVAGLSTAAATSGVSMDTIAAASVRLTASLSKADEEGSAAAQAIKAIGLNMAEFQKLSPVAQLEATAKALATFEDGAGKTAAAVALFGKSGAQLIPFFNDLNEAGGRTEKLTQAQIEAADKLTKQYASLREQTSLLAQQLSANLIPSLSRAVEELQEGSKAVGGFFAAWSAGATLNPFDNTSQAISSVRAELDALNKASIGGGLIRDSNGEIVDATENIKRLQNQLVLLGVRQKIETKDLFGPQFLDARDLRVQGATNKPTLDFKVAANGAKTAKKEVDEFMRVVERLNKMQADAEGALREAFSGQELFASQKALNELVASEPWGKFTAAQQDALKARYDMLTALERETKGWEDKRKATEDAIRAEQQSGDDRVQAVRAFTATLGAYKEENDYLQQSIDLIGKDELARDKLAAKIDYERLRKQALMADDLKGIEILDEQYAKRLKHLEVLDATAKKMQDIQGYNQIGASSLSSTLQDLTKNPRDWKNILTKGANDLGERLNSVAIDKLSQQLFSEDGPFGGFGKIMSDLFGTGEKATEAAALTTAGTTLTTAGTLQTTAAGALSAAAAALSAAAAASGVNSASNAANGIAGMLAKFWGGSGSTGGVVGGIPENFLPGGPAGFAKGIDFVPKDQLAVIHRGERVMTANDNARYSRGADRRSPTVVNQSMTFNVPNTSSRPSIAQMARRMSEQFRAANRGR